MDNKSETRELKIKMLRQLKKEWLKQLLKENGSKWVRKHRKLLAAQWEYIMSM